MEILESQCFFKGIGQLDGRTRCRGSVRRTFYKARCTSQKLTEDTLEQEQEAAGDRGYNSMNLDERFGYAPLEPPSVSEEVNRGR